MTFATVYEGKRALERDRGIVTAGLGGDLLGDIMNARRDGLSVIVGSFSPAHYDRAVEYDGAPAVLTVQSRTGLDPKDASLVVLPWTVAEARGQANIDNIDNAVFERVLWHPGPKSVVGFSALMAVGMLGGQIGFGEVNDDAFDPTCILTKEARIDQWIDNGTMRRNPSLKAVILCASQPSDYLISKVLTFFGVPVIVNYGIAEAAPLSITTYTDSVASGKTVIMGEHRMNKAGTMEVRGSHVASKYIERDILKRDGDWIDTGDENEMQGRVLKVLRRPDPKTDVTK